MIVLDVTIVGVALPSIREDLGFSETSLAWVVNAYLLTFGGFLLLGGRLGDLFGHRRLFLIGIAALHGRLARLRARELAGCARRRAGGAGSRRRDRLGGRALADRDALHRAGRAREGDGRLRVRRGGRRLDRRVCSAGSSRTRSPGTGSSSSTSRSASRSSRSRSWCSRRERRGLAACGSTSPARSTVTASLMVAVYAIVNGNEVGWTTTRTLGLLAVAGALLALFLVIESRVEAPLVPLGLFRLAQPRGLERRRRALGGGDVRVVLPLRALSPARARLQPARGRARVPPRQPHHGRVLARPLGEARDALRDSHAARCRPRPRGSRPAALRARAGRRIL